MNAEDRIARLDELRTEIEDLASRDGDLEGDDAERWESVNDEFDVLRSEQDEFERREARKEEVRVATEAFKNPANRISTNAAKEVTESFAAHVGQGDPFDLSDMNSIGRSQPEIRHELRERVLRGIDGDKVLSSDQKTEIERKVDTVPGAAQHVLATASPAYQRGFMKMASGREFAIEPDERAALERAMSLTDSAGGFMVPTHLDPSVIVTNVGSANPYRQISRVVSVTGDNWNGVTSAGVTASWDTESAEVSDDAPAFQQPSLSPVKGQAFVPISFEAFEDIGNIAGEVLGMITDAKDRLEEAAFTTGSGSGEPEGVVTALVSEVSRQVFNATNSSIAVGDLTAAQNALGARFRGNASWVMNLSVLNAVRELGTDAYASQTVRLNEGLYSNLLGRPVYESTTIDGSLSTGTDYSIVFGDFSQFVIADRLGLSVEFIPNLFATGNNRPSGNRGWLAHWRVDSDVVNNTAFVLAVNGNTAYLP